MAPQVDDEVAHRLVAIGRVFFERLFDNRAQRLRNTGRQRLGRLVDERLQAVQIRLAFERFAAADELIQDDAKGENIAAGVERSPGGLFGRHVRDCAKDGPGAGSAEALTSDIGCGRALVQQLCQSEIGQLGIATARDQDVLGLDVPMQNAGVMRGGQPVADAD